MSSQSTSPEHTDPSKSKLHWVWWVLLGVCLYALDQISKFLVVCHFPLNYINEHSHLYFQTGHKAYTRIAPDGTVDAMSTALDLPRAEVLKMGYSENEADVLEQINRLEPISFFDGMVNIVRVHNTGVAFGLGNGTTWSRYLFLAIPILALGFIIWMYTKKFFNTLWLKVAFVLLIAGILGNLTDRLIQGFVLPYYYEHSFFTKLFNGYVVDFIDVTIPIINYRWPSFNIADSCIFVAAFIFFFAGVFSSASQQHKQPTHE